MKALLLSAGFGKRIGKLTKTTPKCLLKINNKPILQIWIEQLIENNVSEIIINTHYLHKKVTEFIEKKKFKIKITIVYESQLLGTAGTLLKNMKLYKNDDLLIIHTDNYFPTGLSMFLKYNKNKNLLFSLISFKTTNPEQCGILKYDKNLKLINLYEKIKNPPSNDANGAIYFLNNKIIKIILDNCPKAKDFVNDIIPKFYGKIDVYKTTEQLIDIGTYQNYKKANLLSKKIYSSKKLQLLNNY